MQTLRQCLTYPLNQRDRKLQEHLTSEGEPPALPPPALPWDRCSLYGKSSRIMLPVENSIDTITATKMKGASWRWDTWGIVHTALLYVIRWKQGSFLIEAFKIFLCQFAGRWLWLLSLLRPPSTVPYHELRKYRDVRDASDRRFSPVHAVYTFWLLSRYNSK